MLQRFFLGWDRPFLTRAADWLLERPEDLPQLLVLVPTSQAARRLRERLAEQAGALLAPRIATPGSLLQTRAPDVAADWMENVAWLEMLEQVGDWAAYQELFPLPPQDAGPWADGLAGEMVQLRRSLQENGLSVAAAARHLAGSVEAGRWEALARLEARVERTLKSWGLQSRTQALAADWVLPGEMAGIVLAGITEMPPLLERACQAWSGPLSVLIGAPEQEAHAFSATGKPLACWTQRLLPWPEAPTGSVRLVADSRQQAAEAMRAVTETQSASHDVALGSADPATSAELARAFTRHGWPAFHPAAISVSTGLARWFRVWASWLDDPKLATLADLLALPETAVILDTPRAELAESLARLRNDWMVMRPEDLRHRLANPRGLSPASRTAAANLLKASNALESWRNACLQEPLTASLPRLLETLAHASPEAAESATTMSAWLGSAAHLIHQVKRGPGFWIGLMLDALPTPIPQAPEGRVIDVQGWLELFFEPGKHLVLCGLNEGSVPAQNAGDPWLGEAARKQLGLTGNSERAARDAFLYQAMIEARRTDGRADVICAKSGPGGESLLPSRLLLAAGPADLPQRVQFLFRHIEPPDAGLRWHADWLWQPRQCPAPARLPVTSLATYLACPLRFYLKFALGMQRPEPDRVEWNARDFGTLTHRIMERFGLDPDARSLTQPEALHAWLSAELDHMVSGQFGPRVPLAVRVQTEALRQRLVGFARVQAATHDEGWDIIEVESKFEIPIGTHTLVGKIDRIDRHRDHGTLRVIDYKTGKNVPSIESQHRKKITAATVIPAHLGANSPAIYQNEANGKPADFLWHNLQLPLYALAANDRLGDLPAPCYFTLGATEADIALHEWSGFSADDLEAARACAAWIVSQIAAGVFWPPADKATYDDFAPLSAGKSLVEMCAPPAQAPSLGS